ncbi:molybdate ABC transporter substrate-binding protein [Labrys miyagiensis]
MTNRSTRLALAVFLALACTTAARAAETVTVFAAASLKNALDDAAAAFKAKTGIAVVASYAGSPALVKQIEQGAPADLFVSADEKWMDYAADHKLIRPESRVNLLGNSLVVIAPKDAKTDRLPLTSVAFEQAVGTGKWSTGTVNTVPCGIYAKEAMTKLGMWQAAEPRLAQTDNVRAAMQFVSRGEAALGVVYQTDANADPTVKVVATFPDETHTPIVYPFALTATAKGEAPAQFLAFLAGEEAKPIFLKQGFVLLKR